MLHCIAGSAEAAQAAASVLCGLQKQMLQGRKRRNLAKNFTKSADWGNVSLDYPGRGEYNSRKRTSLHGRAAVSRPEKRNVFIVFFEGDKYGKDF